MSAPPDRARAPELERAVLREANEQFTRLLEAAIRTGRERDRSVAPATPGAERPLPFVRPAAFDLPPRRVNGVTMKEYCRAWRDRQRQARHAIERRAHREQLALLEPKPRPRPAIGQFTIMDLAEDTCRFPLGDGPFLFCGTRSMPGKPYCASCARGLYRCANGDDVALAGE
jgi:GcrA cell cycle regulator